MSLLRILVQDWVQCRYQSDSRRTWREECAGHLNEGPKDGTSESVDDHPPSPRFHRDKTVEMVAMKDDGSHSQERSFLSSSGDTGNRRLLQLSERDLNAENNQQVIKLNFCI